MLDLKFIQQNEDLVRDAVRNKKASNSENVDKALKLGKEYKAMLQKVETHRSLRNEISKSISKASKEERKKLIEEATELKSELEVKEKELTELKNRLDFVLATLPNVYASDVPVGKDENENVVLRSWGKIPEFDFIPKDHVDLGADLGIIDIETSAIVSGSRFNYLFGDAVLLQFGIIQFVMKTLGDQEIVSEMAKKVGNPSDKVFTPVLPPVFVKSEIAKKMDRFDPIEDRYFFEKDDQLLVGSAEHTLGPIYMDSVLSEEDLPIRFIGYSTAFRREAGSYGKDTRGILRRHQFDKLEMETFSTPQTGQLEQELIVALQEYTMQKMEIPYEVMMICTGDMGKPDYRQIDINAWMPGHEKYRETHTSDYMTDFQARRLNTRYRDSDGDIHFVHMNDATAGAIGRLLIAIIENNQQKDGTVVVPKVLRDYVGKEVIKKI